MWDVLQGAMEDSETLKPKYLKMVKNRNSYEQVIRACEKQAKDELIESLYSK